MAAQPGRASAASCWIGLSGGGLGQVTHITAGCAPRESSFAQDRLFVLIDIQLRQRWNSAAAAFLAAELETGSTSVELAATSRNDENKIVYCRHAWTAYDAVLQLCKRVRLHDDERADIEIRLALLKEKIEGIKPWGRLARETVRAQPPATKQAATGAFS